MLTFSAVGRISRLSFKRRHSGSKKEDSPERINRFPFLSFSQNSLWNLIWAMVLMSASPVAWADPVDSYHDSNPDALAACLAAEAAANNPRTFCVPNVIWYGTTTYYAVFTRGYGGGQYLLLSRFYFPYAGCPGGGHFVSPGVCESQLVVKLSPASGASESDTVITSIEPGADPRLGPTTADTALLVARVYDQSDQLVPNIDVRLTVDVITKSGGHDHGTDGDERHLNYSGKLSLVGNANGTVTDNGKTLTGNTDSAGLLFRFTSPTYPNNPAGDHDITAECISRTCKQEGPKRVWVGVKDLVHIPDVPRGLPFATYQLHEANGRPVGWTQWHNHNHYLTSEAILRLWNLGFRYSRIEFPSNPLLHINDASLERGGVFDLNRDWRPQHHEHKRGTVVDIKANTSAGSIPESAFGRFTTIAANMGVDAEVHFDIDRNTGQPILATRHFHVRLFRRKE